MSAVNYSTGPRSSKKTGQKERPVQENHKNPFDASGSPPTEARPDFHLFSDVPNPSVWLLSPISKNACSWIAENISDAAMWFGSSLVVEHRYCAALIAQIERDGLRVAVSR